MNKKASAFAAAIFIGILIGAILLFAGVRMYRTFTGVLEKKPDEASLNSFDVLVYEIDRLEDKDTKATPKERPYYLKPGFHLRAGIPECAGGRLCLCQDAACREGIIKSHSFSDRKFALVHIVGSQDRKTKNVQLWQTGDHVYINDTFAKA